MKEKFTLSYLPDIGSLNIIDINYYTGTITIEYDKRKEIKGLKDAFELATKMAKEDLKTLLKILKERKERKK